MELWSKLGKQHGELGWTMIFCNNLKLPWQLEMYDDVLPHESLNSRDTSFKGFNMIFLSKFRTRIHNFLWLCTHVWIPMSCFWRNLWLCEIRFEQWWMELEYLLRKPYPQTLQFCKQNLIYLNTLGNLNEY